MQSVIVVPKMNYLVQHEAVRENSPKLVFLLE